MSALLQAPHGLIRRHLSWVERSLTAAGLAGLVYLLVTSRPAYPPFWDLVLVAAVFAGTLYSPALGFFVAVLAAAYPVFTLSLYLGALYLVVALLGQRVFIHNLGGTVLVLAAPLLNSLGLAWAVPVLGGLWWGAGSGAWIGLFGALWAMVVAGMGGLAPDTLHTLGQTPSMAAAATQFTSANSLETLTRLLAPLAPDTTLFLYHLLQMAAWATAGALVGWLTAHPALERRRPWGAVGVVLAGTTALPLALLALGFWLQQHTLATLQPLWGTLLAASAAVAASVSALEILRDFFEHPLPRLGRARPAGDAASPAHPPGPTPLPVPPKLPAWDQKPGDDPDDLIMLELD